MPANLSPEYKSAQEAYRRARDPKERLEHLREMLRTIPKHKGTEHLQADLKTRLKELTAEIADPRRGGPRGGPVIAVRPEGAGQVALLGPPNSGKSSLHARLTGSHAVIGPYPFATKLPLPGMLPHEDVHFQLLDLPPIGADYLEPWMGNALECADAALLVLDLAEPDCVEQVGAIRNQLETKRVSLLEAAAGASPPAVGPQPGLSWPPEAGRRSDAELKAEPGRGSPAGRRPEPDQPARSAKGSEAEARSGSERLSGGGAHAAETAPAAAEGRPESTAAAEALENDDPFRVSLPMALLANKSDLQQDPTAELQAFRELSGLRCPALAVSADTGHGLAEIGPLLFAMLGVLRVYTKVPGHPPELGRPFTLRRGASVRQVAQLVHRGRSAELKFARVWGEGEYDGQQVSPEHVVRDRHVVELHW